MEVQMVLYQTQISMPPILQLIIKQDLTINY